MDEAALGTKPTERGMSPMEALAHLAEVYQFVITVSQGGEHEWGTYTPPDTSLEGMLQSMQALRAKAVSLCLSREDFNLQRMATDYILLHDSYHVGQLSLVRMATDPTWDTYAIYGD
jgi:hypothetical protein